MSLGMTCPKEGCGGYLTEKRSRRGKVVLRLLELLEDPVRLRVVGRPVPQPCPNCGAPFIVQKVSKAGTRLRCLKPECDYTADAEAEAEAGGESRRDRPQRPTPTGPASSVG